MSAEMKRELYEELEAFAFIAGVYCGTKGKHKPMNEKEAELTIYVWNREGISLPKGLNAENLRIHWNAMCENGGANF